MNTKKKVILCNTGQERIFDLETEMQEFMDFVYEAGSAGADISLEDADGSED